MQNKWYMCGICWHMFSVPWPLSNLPQRALVPAYYPTPPTPEKAQKNSDDGHGVKKRLSRFATIMASYREHHIHLFLHLAFQRPNVYKRRNHTLSVQESAFGPLAGVFFLSSFCRVCILFSFRMLRLIYFSSSLSYLEVPSARVFSSSP